MRVLVLQSLGRRASWPRRGHLVLFFFRKPVDSSVPLVAWFNSCQRCSLNETAHPRFRRNLSSLVPFPHIGPLFRSFSHFVLGMLRLRWRPVSPRHAGSAALARQNAAGVLGGVATVILMHKKRRVAPLEPRWPGNWPWSGKTWVSRHAVEYKIRTTWDLRFGQ